VQPPVEQQDQNSREDENNSRCFHQLPSNPVNPATGRGDDIDRKS
jgi:hypothetical protein